jgi:Brp/Blh family beta-carotene 15,15'-monooxygenase
MVAVPAQPSQRSPDQADRWRRGAGVVLVAATGLFAGLQGLGATVPLAWQAGIYLVGMVLLNLPHGAVENWLNLRGRGVELSLGYVAAFLGLIAGGVGLYLAAPVAGLALALTVAMAKAGAGDLAVLRAFGADAHLTGPGRRALVQVVRGGAVMIVPIAAHPEVFQSFAGMMVALVDPAAMPRLAAGFDALRGPLVTGFALAAGLHLLLGLRDAWRRPGLRSAARVELAETALLLVFFTVVPVLVAVGLYFPFWYSARQLARALKHRETPQPARLSGAAGLGLAALIAGTAAAAAAFAWALPMPIDSGRLYDGVAFWTMFISLIALPHVVIAGWLDSARGIWRTAV